jgi:hypothetical protein
MGSAPPWVKVQRGYARIGVTYHKPFHGTRKMALESEGERGEGNDATCVAHVPENRFEADILCQALEREGIRASCIRHEETAYNGIFIPQRGWGAILVPLAQRERAIEIIREALKIYREKPSPSG